MSTGDAWSTDQIFLDARYLQQDAELGGDLSGTPEDATVVNLNGVPASGYKLVKENVNTVATSGAAQTIPDVAADTASQIVLSANCTFTFPAAVAGKSFLLALKQDATGSRLATFPGTVLWPGATAPTLTTAANKTDLLSFTCLDGTHWLGRAVAQNY